MDFLEGLNPQQREAVQHVEGPLLLLAGAGSGKTRVITHRMAHLVTHHHVPGPAILAVTFTNKASGEMRDRVLRLIGQTTTRYAPWVSTFHRFCVRLLRKDGVNLAAIRPGFTVGFNIYDDSDQLSIVKSAFRHLGLDEQLMTYRAALSRISSAKNHKETPEDFYKKAADPKAERLAVIFEHYEGRLRQANALDFDDLLIWSVKLLGNDAAVREEYNRRFEFVMIDEYQDTNRTQYELMRMLTHRRENVAVVGDEDQSIYGWRGADIKNILDFQKDFPRARVIRLEQNYRSLKNILDAASAVVKHNKERLGKNLWTEAGDGEKVSIFEAQDGENEALFIADTIEKELRKKAGTRVAVLYRTNFQSRQIEEALRRYNRKYVVVGGLSFYDRSEVKDLLCYLKTLVNPNDSVSLERIVNVPARGIGKTSYEQIEKYAVSHGISVWTAMAEMLDRRVLPTRAEAAVSAFKRLIEELMEGLSERKAHETLHLILDRSGYQKMIEEERTPESESRMGNIVELVNAAADGAERGESLTEFLDHAALVSDADGVDEKAYVSLLTMHNAKGLEWSVVFIAGMEEGLFPHSRSNESESQLEEERRLCYVALTRAQTKLYLSWARYRRRFGGGSPEASLRSRFVDEVPKALTEKVRGVGDFPQVNLEAESFEVREVAKRNMFTGKTYNSVNNISQFFSDRGMPPPRGIAEKAPAAPAAPAPIPVRKPENKVIQMPLLMGQPAAARPAVVAPPVKPAAKPAFGGQSVNKKRPFGPGSYVHHPKYGRGTVLKREGDGPDAKLTVNFPGHGLKKLVERFAGLKIES